LSQCSLANEEGDTDEHFLSPLFIFVGIIACMAILTANTIQQIRRDLALGNYQRPVVSKVCSEGQICLARTASLRG
jgi:hypothetical protein